MRYQPDLTFEANARGLLQIMGSPFIESHLAQALRDAYEDGWLDARARAIHGYEVSEVPGKD